MLKRVVSVFLLMCVWQSAMAKDMVRLGAEADWLPFSGNVSGRPTGFSVEVVRAAYEEAGVDVVFVSYPYARCLELARRGVLDGCFDIIRNREREATFLWHRRPLLHARIAIYARSTAENEQLVAEDLSGRSVAVTLGYEYGDAIDLNPRIKRYEVLRDENGFRMLKAGRVDYMLAYRTVANQLFERWKNDFEGQFKEVGVAYEADVFVGFSLVHATSGRYAALLDDGLDKVRRNGRYRQLQERWRIAD